MAGPRFNCGPVLMTSVAENKAFGIEPIGLATMNRKIISLLASIGLILAGMGMAKASGAWWQLCDDCTTESEFRHQALQAPDHLTTVYVTNRDTNRTRKYDRQITWEQSGKSLRREIRVTETTFPADEQHVFEQAVTASNRLEAEFGRNKLGWMSLRDQSSVAGDMQYGTFSPAFVSASYVEMVHRDLAPIQESINEQARLKPPILDGNYGEGGTLRKKPLRVQIRYEDGSVLGFRLQPNGDADQWFAADAAGNEIPLKTGEGRGNIPVDFYRFAGHEFVFGRDAAAAVETMVKRIPSMTDESVACTSSAASESVVLGCEAVD